MVKKIGKTSNAIAALQQAVRRIALLKGESKISDPENEEIDEANLLVSNYEHFLDSIASEGEIYFRPRINGAGIIDEMEGDFCTSKTLYEVKAVNRNLQSGDLRQVLCYIVAGLGSRRYFWSEYCIFNPRLAVCYKGRIDDLLGYLSGRTAPECISDVLDAWMEREQPLEIKF